MKTALTAFALVSFSLLAVADAADPATADYTVHEWGTFTSVQGADGVQMPWNPPVAADLPGFVYTRSKIPGLAPGKTGTFALQRLETPVLYFHAPKPLKVDVAVAFPLGTVTEWFPSAEVPPRVGAPGPAITWAQFFIVPNEGEAKKALPRAVLHDDSHSHYYAARLADTDWVQTPADKGKIVTERFLFYRGVGNFQAPLTVTHPAGGDEAPLRFANAAAEPLRDLFLVQVHDGKMALGRVSEIPARGTASAGFDLYRPLAEARADLAAQMQPALVRAGLTDSEAAAMIKTWDDSWFTENGTRILYLLPPKWADEILPLTLKPAPREIRRVFVGRAELITPEVESALAAEVARFSSDRTRALAAVRALGLGRFLQSAFALVYQRYAQDEPLKRAAAAMQAALLPPPAQTAATK